MITSYLAKKRKQKEKKQKKKQEGRKEGVKMKEKGSRKNRFKKKFSVLNQNLFKKRRRQQQIVSSSGCQMITISLDCLPPQHQPPEFQFLHQQPVLPTMLRYPFCGLKLEIINPICLVFFQIFSVSRAFGVLVCVHYCVCFVLLDLLVSITHLS